MTVTSEWYGEEPVITLTGGSDYDWRLTLDEVSVTTVDGRVTDIFRIGRYDFTGWGSFRCVKTSYNGLVQELVSVSIDGPPSEGTLAIRGSRFATWRLQQAGVRGGRMTVLGRAPGGGEYTVCPLRFVLAIGSTPPTSPPVPDWTVLR